MRSALLLGLAALCGVAAADPLDAELARGTMQAKGPAGMVAIAIETEPTPELLALLERYSVPATLYVPANHWNTPLDPAELEDLTRTEVSLGLQIVRGDDVAAALERAGRAGYTLGTFVARQRFGTTTSHAKRVGLTEVTPSISITRANLKAQLAVVARGGVIVRVAPDAVALLLDALEAESCERLARKAPSTVPVSLHYFVRDRGKPRLVPEHIQARTGAYSLRLSDRCEERATGRAPGDFPPPLKPRPRIDIQCVDNPLAKGCS